MGHLVNSLSVRFGWFAKWVDCWYTSGYNYASFMFICLRQRAILRMFLYAKIMDKTPYIFSHFEFEKFFKFIKVKIYFYFIPFFGLIRRAYKFIYNKTRRWKRKFFKNKFKRLRPLRFFPRNDYYLSRKLLTLGKLNLNFSLII